VDVSNHGANDAVKALEKYCKANPGVPEHSLMTRDTFEGLHTALFTQFKEQMGESWDKSIRTDEMFWTNCPKTDVGTVPIKNPVTGIVSTNLGATIEMRVEQVSQEPNQVPDSYRFIATAAARVNPDGSIGYINCYRVGSKRNKDTGMFEFLRDPPIENTSASTAPSNTFGSRA
jgi:hypothetical protein